MSEPESGILPREIEDEMKSSYLDYAMSVLVGRALPDVRDGLKPVHRRVLFTMRELNLTHNKSYRKSARIVGDALGKFHPHGDSSVYDALVRMAQDFSLRYPLVEGQGNFGSIDGDNPAAMRYTEARFRKISEEILADIDKDTVNFVPNFDGSLKEPVVLPSKFPNLLVNGSSGIAVGMATNIPPHNLREVSDAMLAYLDNNEISIQEIMQHVKGPDFPTGATIMGQNGIRQAYSTGRGSFKIRAKTEIVQNTNRSQIIVNEIPYQINKSTLLEEIAGLVKNKVVLGISNISDESNKEGIRVVIDLKKDADPNVLLNQLYQHSRLESSFGINIIAIVNNEPKTLTLKDLIVHFIQHRKQVVTRRTTYELNQAEDKAHILEGIIIALDNIDAVIELIRKSADTATAKQNLISSYKLTEKQASAILEMRLSRLASMEQQKVRDDLKSLIKLIVELKEILSSEEKLLAIIRDEVTQIRDEYSDERRTQIDENESEIYMDEDLIKSEEMIVTITHKGYIKRLPVDTYRLQHRGGRGVMGADTREGDFVEHVFVANTHSYILFFTEKGIVHWLKVYNLPEGSRQSMGKAIVNLLQLENDRVTSFIPVRKFEEGNYLIMATKNGLVKKTDLARFSRPRKGGIIAISLNESDNLIGVNLTNGTKNIVLCTKNGSAVRFHESKVRAAGRTAMGVTGIRLRDDEVVSLVECDDTETLLTITKNGFGKRTPVKDYRLINRGGYGVINIQTTERNGKTIVVKAVQSSDDIILISRKGIVIRVAASDISTIGRNTQGARIMRLGPQDEVVSCAVLPKEDDAQ